MFGWIRSKPQCPIDAAKREWLDERWNWLEDEFGIERLRETRVILPRPEFFPDPYAGTEQDVRLMLERVCDYMDLDSSTIELSFYQERRPILEEGWRDGTAGLYHRDGDRFRIWVEWSNLRDPLGLVGTLAHELGHVHLLGHGRISEESEDHEPLTDLLTVFLGLGVFTANSVIHESHWKTGQLSGWSVGRRGYLGMPEYGYAFAKFAQARGEDGSGWSRELRLDVRSAFRQALRFLSQDTSPGKA